MNNIRSHLKQLFGNTNQVLLIQANKQKLLIDVSSTFARKNIIFSMQFETYRMGILPSFTTISIVHTLHVDFNNMPRKFIPQNCIY